MRSEHPAHRIIFFILPPFSLRTKKLRLVRRLHTRPHILHNTILQRPAPVLTNPNIVTLVIESERLLDIIQGSRVPVGPSDAIALVSHSLYQTIIHLDFYGKAELTQ
jgi:hypothetical protein